MSNRKYCELFRRQTLLASVIVAGQLEEGDSAIDATAGTGADTLMMARCVGNRGRVYAFDVQKKAKEQTVEKIKQANLMDCLRFYLTSHENMTDIPEISEDPRIKAVMFNLGYLPGSDHLIMTEENSTKKAIARGLSLLAKGGVMTICAYRHEKGERERVIVENFCKLLGKGIDVHKVETLNHKESPVLYIIQKRG